MTDFRYWPIATCRIAARLQPISEQRRHHPGLARRSLRLGVKFKAITTVVVVVSASRRYKKICSPTDNGEDKLPARFAG
jgi:hypothetical protein